MRQRLNSYGIAGFLALIWVSVLGCQEDGTKYRDIRGYYYPLNELQDGLVYEYREVNNPGLGSSYWYMRSIIQGQERYLSSTYYEQDLLPVQQMRERMVSNGMLLEDLYLYSRDTLEGGRQPRSSAEIVAQATFPFQVRQSGGIFLYHVQWRDPSDTSAWYTVVKNRYFEGDTTFTFKGKSYPAVKFAVKEHYELDQQGVLETTYQGWEVYAKGLGLVHYRKEIKDEMVLEYRLEDRFAMTTLEARFKARYEQ